MSIFNNIRNNWTDISWWQKTAYPKVKQDWDQLIAKLYYQRADFSGGNVLTEDWDQLMILDACRLDLFLEVNWIDGDFNKFISPGSSTSEWLLNTFVSQECSDVVYVTANPMYRTLGIDLNCHSIIDVWESDWDEDLHTVIPEKMREQTIKAYQEYPNKRILAHWNQPHYPFIGKKGQQLGAHRGLTKPQTEQETDRDIWEKLEEGDANPDLVWDAYKENLELALQEVERVLEVVEGKTIISSDHGNMIGEKFSMLPIKIYGHPAGVYSPELIEVPWLEIECGERRTILNGSVNKSKRADEVVEKRLQDLGYYQV